MAEKNNFFYSPNFSPDKNYYSETEFQDIATSINIPDENEINELSEENIEVEKKSVSIIKEMADLQIAIEILPMDVVTIISDILEKLIDYTKQIFPEEEIKDFPEEEIIVINDGSSEKITKDVPEEFGEGVPNLEAIETNISIIVTGTVDIITAIQNNFKKNLLDLEDDYVQKLENLIRYYTQQTLMVMIDSGVEDMSNFTLDYDGDAVSLASTNSKHLHDFIMRSQAYRKQKSKLFGKTHSPDYTMMHIKTWHLSEAQKEQYYNASYKENDTEYSTGESNNLLQLSRNYINDKYKDSFYNMYKYLNSSVAVTKDILFSYVNETKAKGILLKEGINIFETTESKTLISSQSNIATNTGNNTNVKSTQTDTVDNSSSTSTSTDIQRALSIKVY